MSGTSESNLDSNGPIGTASEETIFLTGGTGFIGSHLAEALLARGHTVRCLIRSRPKWLEGLPVEPVAGSLHDRSALEEGCRNADRVYHLAGVTRAPDMATFRRHNVEATQLLLEVLAERTIRPGRVVLASSLAVVGRGADHMATESDPLRPVSRYGRSKAQMERMAWTYTDLPLTVVRPPAVYGPRDRDVLEYLRWMDRGFCPVVGPTDTPRISLVHARDLVDGFVRAGTRPEAEGETYFVGAGQPLAWTDVRDAAESALGHGVRMVRVPGLLVQAAGTGAELWGRLTGTHPPFNRDKAREMRLASTACSSEKARRELGYEPEVDIEEGIADTVRWYRDRGWL